MNYTAPLSVVRFKGILSLLVLTLFTFQSKSQDLSVNLLVDQPDCPGSEDGSIAAFPAGGQPPYSFAWSNGEDSLVLDGLGAGTYAVTVTDLLGATVSASATLTSPTEIIWMINSNYETCAGASDADAVLVSIQGGTSPYSLLWSTGDTTPEVHGLSAGTYTVDITDANGCTVMGFVTIEVSPEGVWAMPIETDVNCYGGNDGSLYIGAMTGTAPYSYTYTNPSFPDTNVLNNLPAGLYGVTVTDANGCTGIALGTVNQPEELFLDLNGVDINCLLGTGGTLNAEASGGTQPYAYNWSTTDTTQSIAGLPVGNYSVTVTDQNNCSVEGDALLRSKDTIAVTLVGTDETCLNAGDASASADSISGGLSPYVYEWSTGDQSPSIDNLTTGLYSLSVSDSLGCSGFAEISISASPDGLQVDAQTDSTTCFDTDDGTASVEPLNGAGPYQFAWSHDPLETDATVTGLSQGDYTATVTDANGCTTAVPLTIASPPDLTILLQVTDDDCGNGFNGSIGAEVTNGAAPLSFLWQNGATQPELSGLAPGPWTVTVTDANGCSATESALITGDNPEAGTVAIVSGNSCLTASSANLTATADGNQDIPQGYQLVYLLVQQPGAVIIDLSTTPQFDVFSGGIYTIHPLVYNPVTLDLAAVIDLGSTTLAEFATLFAAQGGPICADLDLVGATAEVAAPDAGEIVAVSDDICMSDPTVTLEALTTTSATIPTGYTIQYLLVAMPDQTIIQTAATPQFDIDAGGEYAIHPLVFDPAQTTLSQLVTLGVTTLPDLAALLEDSLSGLCADLSLEGAQISVKQPLAGSLSVTDQTLCLDGTATLSGIPQGGSQVPDGFTVLYLISKGSDRIVTDFGADSQFIVSTSGTYSIHAFVFDPSQFSTVSITVGVTTIAELEALLLKNGGSVCGDLDTTGAEVKVEQPDAGTLQLPFDTICFSGTDSLLLAGTHGSSPIVPDGYQVRYLLVSGSNPIIQQVSDLPSFTVVNGGSYTIHTLVFDPLTLSPAFTEPGKSLQTLLDLISAGGGSICADLDLAGAKAVLQDPDAGILVADQPGVCLFPGQVASLSASVLGAPVIPNGFKSIYLLGTLPDKAIVQTNAVPSFTVDAVGQYTIHTLVYDTLGLNPDTLSSSYQTAEDLWKDLSSGGGDICGDLDLDGIEFSVNPCDTCTNIGDYVWIDYNENGIQDGVEIGLHNVPVTLMAPGPDEIFDTPDDIMVDYQLTNYSGYYLFTCVGPGEYRICVTELPQDFYFTVKDAGNNDFIDSDVDTLTGCTDPFFVVQDQPDNLSFDIGVVAECLDLDFGGVIGYSQTICAGTMPDTIIELVPASGGLGEIEYMWMFSTTPGSFNQQTWIPIPNSNTPFFKPPVLLTTTYYVRCARRADCDEFVKETNVVVITVLPYDTGDCPPLLLNVSATPLFDGSVLLNWTSANEMGQVEYQVEHAADGLNFSPLKVVSSKANGLSSNAYSLSHEHPARGTNTYRISVQNSGQVLMYSDTVQAMMPMNDEEPITVYPNPFRTSFRVFSSGKMISSGTLELYTASGQLIEQRSYTALQTLSTEFVLDDQPAGVYLLRVIPEGGQQTSVHRLMKM